MTKLRIHPTLEIQTEYKLEEVTHSAPSVFRPGRSRFSQKSSRLKRIIPGGSLANEAVTPSGDSPQNDRHSPSHKVSEGLYVGNSRSGDQVFEGNPDGISLVVNLYGKKTYEEPQYQNSPQIELLNINVQDSGHKAEEFLTACSGMEGFRRNDVKTWFKEAFERIDHALEYKRKVLIHCHEGISRSVTLTTAYLMKKEGLSFDRAIAIVKNARKKADPNLGFYMLLQEYGELLEKEREKEADEAKKIQYLSFITSTRCQISSLPEYASTIVMKA